VDAVRPHKLEGVLALLVPFIHRNQSLILTFPQVFFSIFFSIRGRGIRVPCRHLLMAD
jgi:hypothetical protein